MSLFFEGGREGVEIKRKKISVRNIVNCFTLLSLLLSSNLLLFFNCLPLMGVSARVTLAVASEGLYMV